MKGNFSRNTTLLNACGSPFEKSPIEKVKLLVEAGADINHQNEFKTTPLYEATLKEHYDVVLYLLQKGADYTIPIFDLPDSKKVYLADQLRHDVFPLDSKKYKDKMLVVDFLKQKGIDYRKLPVPDKVVKDAKELYPQTWQDYLEKY